MTVIGHHFCSFGVNGSKLLYLDYPCFLTLSVSAAYGNSVSPEQLRIKEKLGKYSVQGAVIPSQAVINFCIPDVYISGSLRKVSQPKKIRAPFFEFRDDSSKTQINISRKASHKPRVTVRNSDEDFLL